MYRLHVFITVKLYESESKKFYLYLFGFRRVIRGSRVVKVFYVFVVVVGIVVGRFLNLSWCVVEYKYTRIRREIGFYNRTLLGGK